MLATLLLVAGPALAGPRSIDDCEAIKDPSPYNLCLASFGPMRGQHGATYPGVATEGEKSATTSGKAPAGQAKSVSRHARGGHGAGVSRGRGGRVRMEFTPGR